MGCDILQGRRAHHEEEIPLPHRQPQCECDTQPTERQRELASARHGHCFRSCYPSLVSLQGCVVSSPIIGMVVALCSTLLGSTSGESIKSGVSIIPSLSATVVALLSLLLVLLDFRDSRISWCRLVLPLQHPP